MTPENPQDPEQQQQAEFMGKPVRWWQRTGGTVLVISILAHLLFAFIAGYFVVQHFMTQPKPKPPVMALAQRSESVKIKMDVREKSMAAPAVKQKVTTTNELAKVALPEMPDVPTENVMPSLMPGVGNTFGTAASGSGNGNGGGGGMRNTTLFGTPNGKTGLMGTFFDFKQNPARNNVENNFGIYQAKMKKFVDSGWKQSVLSDYYKVRNAVASTMIFIPNIQAELGPRAFNVHNRVEPRMWMVHYTATVVPPESGTYHFIGAGDDMMLASIDNKLVLDRSWNVQLKEMSQNFEYHYTGIPKGFGRSDAFTVEAGKEYKLDVAIGEMPGGKLFAFLFIEKEGVTPKTGPTGLPIFPVFRVAKVELPEMPGDTELPPFDRDMPSWSIWKTVPPKQGILGIDTKEFFKQH
jgi:hypothetical protein